MRLNIGCASEVHPGWFNIDREPYPGIQWLGDVLDGLPLDDGDAELAVAHHVLQMVAWPDLLQWLREVRRVVREGGALRLSVPDVLGAIDARERGDRAWFPIDPTYAADTEAAFCMYVTQAGATRSIFTPAHLIDLCERAGWGTVRQVRFRETFAGHHITALDNRPDESVFIEAT